MLKRINYYLLFFIAFLLNTVFVKAQTNAGIDAWLTDPANSILFKQQSKQLLFNHYKIDNNIPTIKIDTKQTYQSIEGFGFALTGGSAMHIFNMDATKRTALLKELFKTDENNIGTSYLRISIGASDLDDHTFSYDDLSTGETDLNLEHFNLGVDKKYLIPVLKEILAINPSIKILASPWSPPTWMKTNDSTKGGSLKPQYYAAYANYFIKYITAMKAEGITINAITIQNEPLHPGNNPSMLMLASEQAAFIKNNLGPAFKTAGIKTKIILYDHNADRPDYPISILNDADARQYVDGSAFHLYGGKIEALSQVHDAYPDKNLYFTEQWVGAPGNLKRDLAEHVKKLIIGATRNWCRTVIEWNLAADSNNQPHTIGGCNRCLGAVTIDGDNVKRNPAYYIIAHAAKFVRPGSVRIASNFIDELPNVAFKTPTGKIVLIVLNNSDTLQIFQVDSNNKNFTVNMSANSVGTFIW